MSIYDTVARFENGVLLRSASLPARERVLDRLADLMLGADEVLDVLKTRDAETIRWVEVHIRNVYEEVNDVMKRLCD